MPTLINAMQPSNQLGEAISGLSNNMFNNGAALAMRRAQVQGLQRQNYNIQAMSDQLKNAGTAPLDPQAFASTAILAGADPDKAAGWLLLHGAMNGGPRSPEATNATAAEGKYQDSAENLDLDRGNKLTIANNHNATSIANTGTNTSSRETIAQGRTTSQDNIATLKAGMDAWKTGGKVMPVDINGAPGYVRQDDPALGALPPAPTFGQKTTAVESGGNPTAQNPNSSATGAGQFTDGTWLDMIGKHAPELAQNRTPQQVLALRNDPELSQIMTDKYGDDNGAVLKSQGLLVTDGTKYLAHFLGPGGAVKALKADPRTPMANLVDPGALQANPMLRSMTAGDAVAWANKNMGVGAVPAGAAPTDATDATQMQGIPAPTGQAPAPRVVTPIPKGPLANQNLALPDRVTNGPDGKPDPAAQQAYLDKLSPSDRATVLGMTGRNPTPPEAISIRDNQRNRAIALAQGYAPDYNPTTAKSKAAFYKSEEGDGRIGQAMTSLNTVLGHMNGVGTAGDQMNDLGNGWLNHAANWVSKNNTGPLSAYNMNLEPMGREAETYFAGKGQGSVTGAEAIVNSLSPDMTHDARHAALQQLGGMIKDRLMSYADEHLQSAGDLSDFPAPDVRPMLQKLGVDTKDLDPIYASMKGGGKTVRGMPMPGAAPVAAPVSTGNPALDEALAKYK